MASTLLFQHTSWTVLPRIRSPSSLTESNRLTSMRPPRQGTPDIENVKRYNVRTGVLNRAPPQTLAESKSKTWQRDNVTTHYLGRRKRRLRPNAVANLSTETDVSNPRQGPWPRPPKTEAKRRKKEGLFRQNPPVQYVRTDDSKNDFATRLASLSKRGRTIPSC